MSKKVRVLTVLVLLLLLAGLAFLGRLLWHRQFAKTFFFAYAGMAVISGILLCLLTYVFVQQSLVGLVLRGGIRKVKGWDRFVVFVITALEVTSAALVWPVTLTQTFLNARKETKSPDLVRRRMRDVFGPGVQLYTQAAFEFFIAVLFSICEARYTQSTYLGVMLDGILIIVMLRHLSLLLSPGGVASRIKQSTGSPLPKFLFVLVSDLGSLVFVSSAINARSNGLPLSVDLLRTTFTTLLKGPKALLGSEADFSVGGTATLLHAMPAQRKLTLAAGMLLYASLLRLVTSATTILKRNNEETIGLAHAYIFEEKYQEALATLDDVDPVNARSEDARSTAFLALGQLAKAQVATERSLRLDPDIYFQPTKSDVFFNLLKDVVYAPAGIKKKLLAEAIKQEVSSGIILQECFTVAGYRMMSQDHFEPDWDDTFRNAPVVRATSALMERDFDELVKYTALIEKRDELNELIVAVYGFVIAVAGSPDQAAAKDVISQWKSAEWDRCADISTRLIADREWQCTSIAFLLNYLSAVAEPLDPEFAAQVQAVGGQATERMRTSPPGSYLNSAYQSAVNPPSTI